MLHYATYVCIRLATHMLKSHFLSADQYFPDVNYAHGSIEMWRVEQTLQTCVVRCLIA